MADENIPVTPGILQIIKSGLAFRLKAKLQPSLEAREHHHLHRFKETTKSFNNFRLLGPEIDESRTDRVGIVAFMILHKDRQLHHNFVGQLFNDIFGIQCKS